jgi:predicted enzyme related to lactoylglutathione lyase
MKKVSQVLMGTVVATMLAVGAAHAGVSLMAARVVADDVPALAKFYQSAFGLKEVQRLEFPNMIEIMLNFGDTADAAKASTATQVVIMKRGANDAKDAVPHLIFNVTDMAATVAAVKAAGGKMDGEPRPFGNTGILIGMGTDPAGNRIELIQRAKG